MGLVARLAWRNLKRRPGQAVLLLVVLSLATTAVGLGLAINETGYQPWNRLHHRINGFHVQAVAGYYPIGEAQAPDPAQVARADRMLSDLAARPEVVAVAGPWPQLYTRGRVGGVEMEISVQVRDAKPAAVSHPLTISGRWLDDSADGVVLEDGLASLTKAAPGDEVTIAGQRLNVRGSAMTTSVERYPLHNPALVWVNQATAAKLRAAGAVPLDAVLELRLSRAQDAVAFVAAHEDSFAGSSSLLTWEQARYEASEVTPLAILVTLIATLLAGLTVATAAVLVTGRVAAQGKQIGTLKAVGVTPRQALGVVLVEYLTVAVTAAGIGIVAGTLLSPLLVRNLPNLYGAPTAPPVTWQRALATVSVAVAVVVLGSILPAVRGVRHSTLRSLAAGVRSPKRSGRAARSVARLAALAGLPLPAVLGLRSAGRRPIRTIANATGLAMGVAMVVVVLGADQAARDFLGTPVINEEEALDRTVNAILIDQLLAVVFAAAVVLVALATLNAAIVAIFAARDGARNHAVLRAVGATPGQTLVSFVVAQLGASLLGCAAGIPLGVLLYNSINSGGAKDVPTIALPASSYAAVAVAVPLLYLMIVIIPAARLARRPVAEALTYE